MKSNNSILLVVSFCMVACVSTKRSYSPEESDDFIYDKSQSFAMNVVNGSLGFHNGIMDARIAENADIKADALSKTADTYMGLMSNGIGGALLGLLGSSHGEYPLNSGYGIYYVPIKDTSNQSIDESYNYVNSQIIKATETEYNIKYSHSIWTPGHSYEMIYEGSYCADLQSKIYPNGKKVYTEKYMSKRNITKINQCVRSGYNDISLMKFTTSTPKGQQGNYAVIGIKTMGWFSNLKITDQLDSNFYYIRPVSKINSAPFVYNDGKAWFFIKPESEVNESLSKDEVAKLFPKLF
ncbi:hypothetical protein LMH66_17980 [Shewanella sp. 10N.7]|uniref:hypothetical protein n=1 Tax=Shewanella sp. 10N.7 TaxID=2885093 RepID=UPI001E37F1D3|nr:hypothetical protein [Shewanella sp. 10N.7]MCC4834539.1 hypothetical protein [Shewanella sp. 10N.7]